MINDRYRHSLMNLIVFINEQFWETPLTTRWRRLPALVCGGLLQVLDEEIRFLCFLP